MSTERHCTAFANGAMLDWRSDSSSTSHTEFSRYHGNVLEQRPCVSISIIIEAPRLLNCFEMYVQSSSKAKYALKYITKTACLKAF